MSLSSMKFHMSLLISHGKVAWFHRRPRRTDEEVASVEKAKGGGGRCGRGCSSITSSPPSFTPTPHASFTQMPPTMSAFPVVDDDFSMYNANEVYDETKEKVRIIGFQLFSFDSIRS